ncbi:MAG: HD domain-containing protein [Lachnospiraceae bacterium]|nr:HD domain-containing protein [Lachnospiraceae bacterium]
MKAFIQHGSVTTYDHVLDVARLSYRINKAFRISARERELVRGALLHDYFLYDWHHWDGPLHGPYHPKAALKNAKRDFDLTKREENIIRSHMWPLTPLHIPKTREAVIVCIADKICSARETLFARKKRKKPKTHGYVRIRHGKT